MIARCLHDADHKRFVTTAHVMQEWVVDEQGNFLEEISTIETTHKPDPGNEWTCRECGTTAIVERED